jgi:hypothetical protein
VPLLPPKLERYGDAPGLIRYLLSSPYEDALKTLSDLRGRADLSSILDMLQSEEDQFSSGPDQEGVGFELAVRHPILYPASVTVEHDPLISAQRAGKHHLKGIYGDAQA